MQQISLSQRETKDEIKGEMDCLKEELKGNMDGLKSVMESNMDGWKAYMEGLTNLLQERLPGGDKVIHENHDEEKMNMNYDFRDSNVGFKKP